MRIWFGFNLTAQKQVGNICVYIYIRTYIFQIFQTISQFCEICYCLWMLAVRQQWNEGVTNVFHIETPTFFNRWVITIENSCLSLSWASLLQAALEQPPMGTCLFQGSTRQEKQLSLHENTTSLKRITMLGSGKFRPDHPSGGIHTATIISPPWAVPTE